MQNPADYLEDYLPRASLRRIQLATRRLSDHTLAGEFRSAFHGQGLSFRELRPYIPGDDIRHIDWKATARSTIPFIKTFEPDRRLKVILVVDRSSSMTQSLPRVAEIVAIIGMVAQLNSDLVGYAGIDTEIKSFLAPSDKRQNLRRILSLLKEPIAAYTKTDLESSLKELYPRLRGRALVFLISDFMTKDFDAPLRALARKHDVVAMQLPISRQYFRLLESGSLVAFSDQESGQKKTIDTSHWIKESKNQEMWNKSLKNRVKKSGADHLLLSYPTINCLEGFFLNRVMRR